MPFAIILAFPFVWMAITSLKFQGDVYNPTKTWSFDPTLENYGYLFHHTGYLRWIRNSCFVGLMVTLITLVVAVPAGYALARLAGPHRTRPRRRDLPDLPRSADAALPAVLARDRRARTSRTGSGR